jgi:hypothetical protein
MRRFCLILEQSLLGSISYRSQILPLILGALEWILVPSRFSQYDTYIDIPAQIIGMKLA